MAKSRLRRPQNLKPCHEIRAGLDHWLRVLSATTHAYLPDTVSIRVADDNAEGGQRTILRRRNNPIRARLAEHDQET